MRKLFLAIAFASSASHAAVYYVSPTGNDSNNGTSQSTPWRTLARVQQYSSSAAAGDQVLFQRGGTYTGQLSWYGSGSAAANITIGAYGTGELPVISGAAPVTNWTLHTGNIYKASVSQGVKYVFVNGALQTLARYPNTGWLRVNTSTNTSLTSSNITRSSGYWNGASLVIRSTNWCYENRVIGSHSGSTISYPSITYSTGNYDWGFFLCNKLSELDTPGEWFHDAATGTLYLWAPGGVNPNTLQVEASVHDHGVLIEWQRSRVRVQDIAFRGQRVAGVNNTGTYNTVSGCTFERSYHGIQSYGSNNTYSGNTFRNTYAAALAVLDNGTTVSGNTLTDIALVAGLGETAFGYHGMRVGGGTNIVRENRIHNTGNSGIFVGETATVERNVISNFCVTVNDGGGVYWDNGQNMVIQDNIIRDAVGNIESAATNYSVNGKILPGIYFGNAVIQNCIVQRNTVSNCSIGIQVDHTMVSQNNQVKDNILFNNGVQLNITDMSNVNGPGAAAPYYKASYNTVYSGNQLYSLTPDQLCMQLWNYYQQGNVDFGTFTNNKLFNPYNEMSIRNWNLGAGNSKMYSLERWRTERNKEVGSTRSPLRSSLWSTATEISSNLVLNGNFNSAVNGWGGWPTNAVVTRDMSYLDNGALKVVLPNSSQSAQYNLWNPDQFSVQNGQWYRLRFSIQSSMPGIVHAGVKGVSQMASGHSILSREIPFDGERRDMEIYFQSNLTEQAVTMFSHFFPENTYWLDNVEVHRVTVQPRPALNEHKLLTNETGVAQAFSLPAGCWFDMNGTLLSGPQTVAAYSSKIIYSVPGTGCTAPVATSVGARMLLGGPLNWSTGQMSDNLRQASLIPGTEPYTSMLGYTLENAGATVSASMLNTTGAQAIVDWVVVELRNNDAGHTVAARRAALLRANGEVVSTMGESQIVFSANPVGKRLVVRHRNHLGAMTAGVLAANGQVVDFTSATTSLYGASPLKVSGGHRALWPGDVNSDGSVLYTGAANDRDPVLSTVGGQVPTNQVRAYSRSDVNMDGVVKYTGAGNDRDIVLEVIGGSVPTAVRPAQLP